MSWTYHPELDELDYEVEKDQSTPGRYSFKRYMYFEPSQYTDWSQGKNTNGVSYTAELVNDPRIPSAGTYLSGLLSAFYVNDIKSIKNMNEQEHGDHASYAKVTLEYENMPSDTSSPTYYGGGSSGRSDSQDEIGLKPWQRKVDDFTVTNQQIEVPLVEAYKFPWSSSSKVKVCNSAKQPFYGQTTSKWARRLTWTFNTQSGNYAISEPIINQNTVTLFDKITIQDHHGLLFPPGYKKLYYYENSKDAAPQAYDQWTFEILVLPDPQVIQFIDAGTKAIMSGQLLDICSWYVYDPQVPLDTTKKYGSIAEMWQDKLDVEIYNNTISPSPAKKIWYGDFVQSPVPLLSGAINTAALTDPNEIELVTYYEYQVGSWNLGIR